MKSAWIERNCLTVNIGVNRFQIDIEKYALVEDESAISTGQEFYLPYLRENNQRAVEEYIPSLDTH